MHDYREDPEIYNQQEADHDDGGLVESDDLEEVMTWYQEARHAALEEPEDAEILANFKQARRALDRARTARGFYPVANPNQAKSQGRGGWRDRGSANGSGDHADKICMRCGKRGHIARQCPQRPAYGAKGKGHGHGQAHYIAFATVDEPNATETEAAHSQEQMIAKATS